MAKKTLISVSPAASTPVKRKAEKTTAQSIKAVFAATKKKVLPKLVAKYKAIMEEHRPATKYISTKLHKAIGGEADDVLSELNLDSWVELASEISPQIEAAGADAAKRALMQLKVSEGDELFDNVFQSAVDFALQRAAELVGMRWDGSKLIPNPSAVWAITESTRTGVRDLVVSALTDGLTVAEFADRLTSNYLFSDARAETIARTEIARAHIEGTLDAWKQSGLVTGKRWILGSEHDTDVPAGDECDDNEDDGVIGLEDSFTSGDDGPPAHPNCVCALVTELIPAEEELDD